MKPAKDLFAQKNQNQGSGQSSNNFKEDKGDTIALVYPDGSVKTIKLRPQEGDS
ncbi:MAG: hypothetical protein ACFB2W_04800 [Leptolyngbyaceae cyanobacterium]